MDFQFFVEKLKNSKEYKVFKKENPGSYACSAFFLIDLNKKNSQDKHHIDFFVPEEKKLFSFQLEEGVKLVQAQFYSQDPPLKISLKRSIDFKKIQKLIEKKMLKENYKNKLQKIILSFQNIRGDELLVGTVFISMLGMIKITIDLDKSEIAEFEKKNFLDILKPIRKKKK